MLVLSRHPDEKIHIGDNIVLTVVEVRGDRVRIGIDAPRDVIVHRQEIFDAIQRDALQGIGARDEGARGDFLTIEPFH